MAWLLDAISQAAEGDWEGAANTVSDGVSDTADAAVGAATEAADAAAGAFGFGSGSGSTGGGAKGGQGLVGAILGAADDATGGALSRTGEQMQAAYEAAGKAAADTFDQVGRTASDIVDAGTSAANETARQIGQTTRDVVDTGTSAANETARQIGQTTRDVVDAGTAAANETARQIGQTTRDVVDAGTAAADETARQVGQTASDIVDAGTRAADAATGGRASMVGEHLANAANAAAEGDVSGVVESGQAAIKAGGVGAGIAAGQAIDAVGEAAEKLPEAVDEAVELGIEVLTVPIKAADAVTGGKVSEGLDEAAELGIEVLTVPIKAADAVTGGKFSEGMEHLDGAVQSVAEGDFAGAAQKGAAAATALNEGLNNGADMLDRLTGGRLSALDDAIGDARDSVLEGDIAGVGDAAADAITATSPGGILIDIDNATGGHFQETVLDSEAVDALGAAFEGLQDAADKALQGDFVGAIDVANSAGEAIDGAVADLGDAGRELLDTAASLTPGQPIDTVGDLIADAAQQAEQASAAAGDPTAADEAAGAAAEAFTEVTARLGAATAVTVDDASAGALADVLAGVEQAEAELADGRYDDALAKLDAVEVDLGRVATAISPGRDIGRLPERVAEARQGEALRVEGHERLGLVVDAVGRRLPTTARVSSDPEEGGEVGPGAVAGVAPGSAVFDALTNGHLRGATTALRRAVSVDVDPDEVADAVKEATGHLRATGPAVATSVVAVVDHDAGGHLGDTAGLATRAARALRAGDYDEAATIAPRLAERHAQAMDEVVVEGRIEVDSGLPDDLTEGHADTALRYLDEATILDALGDSDGAIGRAVLAADEYDAAVVSYDLHVERAVTVAAGIDAPEPVRARVVEALDSAAGGALVRPRGSLERGAASARAGDMVSASDAGREATGLLDVARTVYTRPDAPARLVTEVRRAVDEGEPPLDPNDFGRGALRDVIDRSDAADEVATAADGADELADETGIDDPDRLEYEPALESQPAAAIYESPDLVAGLDGSPVESVTADAEPDLLDTGNLGSDFDLD